MRRIYEYNIPSPSMMVLTKNLAKSLDKSCRTDGERIIEQNKSQSCR